MKGFFVEKLVVSISNTGWHFCFFYVKEQIQSQTTNRCLNCNLIFSETYTYIIPAEKATIHPRVLYCYTVFGNSFHITDKVQYTLSPLI